MKNPPWSRLEAPKSGFQAGAEQKSDFLFFVLFLLDVGGPGGGFGGFQVGSKSSGKVTPATTKQKTTKNTTKTTKTIKTQRKNKLHFDVSCTKMFAGYFLNIFRNTLSLYCNTCFVIPL